MPWWARPDHHPPWRPRAESAQCTWASGGNGAVTAFRSQSGELGCGRLKQHADPRWACSPLSVTKGTSDLQTSLIPEHRTGQINRKGCSPQQQLATAPLPWPVQLAVPKGQCPSPPVGGPALPTQGHRLSTQPVFSLPPALLGIPVAALPLFWRRLHFSLCSLFTVAGLFVRAAPLATSLARCSGNPDAHRVLQHHALGPSVPRTSASSQTEAPPPGPWAPACAWPALLVHPPSGEGSELSPLPVVVHRAAVNWVCRRLLWVLWGHFWAT